MMSRARRLDQRRDPRTSSRDEDVPAPSAAHHVPIWTWLGTGSLPRELGRAVRIGVNLAGAAGAAGRGGRGAGRASEPAVPPAHPQPHRGRLPG